MPHRCCHLPNELETVERCRVYFTVVKGSPYSITEQPAGDVSYKSGGRLPLLSARPVVTLATLNRAASNFAAW